MQLAETQSMQDNWISLHSPHPNSIPLETANCRDSQKMQHHAVSPIQKHLQMHLSQED